MSSAFDLYTPYAEKDAKDIAIVIDVASTALDK